MKKILTFLLLVILILPAVACPDSGNEEPPGDDDPVITEDRPLWESPGLRLIYTVNDPRAGAYGVDRTARVLIAEPVNNTGDDTDIEEPRRDVLFSYPGFIFHISPSPAGTHVAFVGSVLGETGEDERHLFIYELASRSYRDVSSTGFYSRAVKTAPVFTSEGDQVIFLSRWSTESGEYNIFKCEVETGRISGLYTEPVEDVPLTLMPDGRHCVSVIRDLTILGVFYYQSINIDTGDIEILYRFENVTKVGPAFVNDTASRIYCDLKPLDDTTSPLGGVRSRLVVELNLEDQAETSLLAPNTVTYVYQIFNYTTNEQRLVLRRQEDITGEDTPMTRIATCRLNGDDFQYLTNTSARSYLLPPPSNIHHISPDHSLIFFYRQDPVFEHEDIWVMRPDGSDEANISNTAGYNEGSAGWIVIP
jgi:hypothetical protein